MPSFSNLSRISQLNMPGFSRLYSSILLSTSGVVPCYRGHKSVSVHSLRLGPWGTTRMDIMFLFTIYQTTTGLWLCITARPGVKFPWNIQQTNETHARVCHSPVPYLGFAAADGSGSDGTRLLVPAQDFGHAAVRDPQLSGDDARPDAVVGHLYDLVPDVVGQRSAIDENSSELVHAALAQRSRHYIATAREKLVSSKKSLQHMLENYTYVCQLFYVMFHGDKEVQKKHLLHLTIALQDYQIWEMTETD